MNFLCDLNSSKMSNKSDNHKSDSVDSWQDARVLINCLISAFICVVCLCGLVGNGVVIWLLGFRIKRNPFSIYILNLAVADFGVLIVSIPIAVITVVDFVSPKHGLRDLYNKLISAYIVSASLSFFFYSTSQFLLTAISIDRCTSVLFPLWYRCRRPKKLSTVLCVLIWLLTSVVHGICLIVLTRSTYFSIIFGSLGNAVICLPLITITTLILFLRFCFKTQQRQRGKLLTAILLTLFFFLIFAFPLNIIYVIMISSVKNLFNVLCNHVLFFGWLCASLNSFVNPFLYFLVGRKKRGLCRENLKLILQRVFIEEKEAYREDPGIQLSDPQKQ